MASLPSYVAAAKPVPSNARIPWYSGIAPTYAGVMVWYAFWQSVPSYGGAPGGILSQGIGVAIIGIIVAALVCHFLFYLVPGLLGMKNGMPLYIVGTSTYGVSGGFLMPGVLMGILQFFWVAFNSYSVSETLCRCFELGLDTHGDPIVPGFWHGLFAVLFAVLAGFMGLKGIKYVAKVATYLPIIPIVVLLVLFFATVGGLGGFSPEKLMTIKAAAPQEPLSAIMAFLAINACVIGFFATAGAAGADIAMNARDEKHVQIGGLVGIALATVFSCVLAVLIVAGYYGGAQDIPENLAGNMNPVVLMKGGILGTGLANILMILLAISAFPAGCFSALIGANSFRSTLSNVKPEMSVGIGTLAAIILAVTGAAGSAVNVFLLIGASFGPVCGAMMADYFLSGMKWAGPRAGFNWAGWISWVVGFAVGIANNPLLGLNLPQVPCPPLTAFLVGLVLYVVLAKAGLESQKLEMPQAAK
jgi:cytosine permease